MSVRRLPFVVGEGCCQYVETAFPVCIDVVTLELFCLCYTSSTLTAREWEEGCQRSSCRSRRWCTGNITYTAFETRSCPLPTSAPLPLDTPSTTSSSATRMIKKHGVYV